MLMMKGFLAATHRYLSIHLALANLYEYYFSTSPFLNALQPRLNVKSTVHIGYNRKIVAGIRAKTLRRNPIDILIFPD